MKYDTKIYGERFNSIFEKRKVKKAEDHIWDLTLGATNLEGIGKNYYKEQAEREKERIKLEHIEFVDAMNKRECFLWCSLASYHSRYDISIYDSLFVRKIINMIELGTLFMRIYPVSQWAHKNSMEEENFKILGEIPGFSFDKSHVNSDGSFGYTGDLILDRVYGPEGEPQQMETITLNNAGGYIEIGSNPICKIAMNLFCFPIPILRLPFEINGWPPFATVFYSNQSIKFNPFDHLIKNPSAFEGSA